MKESSGTYRILLVGQQSYAVLNMSYPSRNGKNDPKDWSGWQDCQCHHGPEPTGLGDSSVLAGSQEVGATAFQSSERELNHQAKY